MTRSHERGDRVRRVERKAKVAVSKPARAAGAKRAGKFVVFGVLGTVLVNGGAIVATLLVGLHLPIEFVSVASLLAGSVAAGVQKSISWVDTGVELPPPTQPTLANPSGGVQ